MTKHERGPNQTPGERTDSYSAWSSVDGRLDVISVRKQPYFVIYEHGTNNRIRCTFPDEWLNTVKDYLGRRVRAEGYVHYRQDGIPAALTLPSTLERVPDPDQLDITVYRGALPGISEELSSYEYVRRLREDDG